VLKTTPEFVAAVDLGSNSFHMIVCSLKDGKLQTVDRLKEMVRLASGLDKKNHLDASTQKRALDCLERFGQRIKHLPPECVRIVGTNTLRTAKNSAQFLVKAEKALTHPIHIIAGVEEARLIYIGVAHSLGSNANLRFVMDIGGGSTEYIIGKNDTPKKKESLNMGCVSVSNLFFKDGIISRTAFNQAVLFAEQELEPFQRKFLHTNWNEAIGSSGSLRSIDKVLQAKNWSNNGITRQGLDQLVEHIRNCRHIDELNLPDLDPERLPVFVGGVAIIYASFKSLGIEQMTVSDGALREGLIQDLLGRIYDHDVRSATVEALAKRYHTDKEHSDRVKKTARDMLVQLNQTNLLLENDSINQFLDWAADLHEIGHDIAHSQHQKHGAYIIENADLAGFSKQDQLVLSIIIRYHRRKFSATRFAELHAPWDELAPYLTIILRLSVLLHRNRDDQALPDYKLAINKNKIFLHFPVLWLNQAPLTQADLCQEAEFLKSAGFKLEFL
jgi:exopolyphosphatase/guanosine-5'-triphosphate,3'-diphosphate pyrophosphatase